MREYNAKQLRRIAENVTSNKWKDCIYTKRLYKHLKKRYKGGHIKFKKPEK